MEGALQQQAPSVIAAQPRGVGGGGGGGCYLTTRQTVVVSPPNVVLFFGHSTTTPKLSGVLLPRVGLWWRVLRATASTSIVNARKQRKSAGAALPVRQKKKKEASNGLRDRKGTG